MNHQEKLLEIYEKSFDVSDIRNISLELNGQIDTLGEKIATQKGVYTVLITLFVHKILHPSQDIRLHQAKMTGGFSARSIDTKYITPTLMQLGLPSMKESGRLTRSLEQAYPYDLHYQGEISNKQIKDIFLKIIDFVEHNFECTESVLRLILNKAIKIREENKVIISPITNKEKLSIEQIIELLDKQFSHSYGTFGGAKLPVLAFYSIYQQIISQIQRYNNCVLGTLGSHTASDRTSNSAGDIEVFQNGNVYEGLEIKLDKKIDRNILLIAEEKIYKFNPTRYYILSYIGVLESDNEEISKIVDRVKNEHGCQIIVNGVIHTLKYYLRLIEDLNDFMNTYSNLIINDTELKIEHKKYWKEIIESL